MTPLMAVNVVCCETAIRLKLGAKRKWLARAQSVVGDPIQTSACLADAVENRGTSSTTLVAADPRLESSTGADADYAARLPS